MMVKLQGSLLTPSPDKDRIPLSDIVDIGASL